MKRLGKRLGIVLLIAGCSDDTAMTADGPPDARADAPVDAASTDGATVDVPDAVVDGPADARPADAAPRYDGASACSTLSVRPFFTGFTGASTSYSDCTSGGVSEVQVRTYDGAGTLIDERTVPCATDLVAIDFLGPGGYSFGLRALATTPPTDLLTISGWEGTSCLDPLPCTHPDRHPCRLTCAAVPACAETTELAVELFCSSTENGMPDVCSF